MQAYAVRLLRLRRIEFSVHTAAAGFPPGDSSEFRSTWLVFGQRLGVARPLGWIGQEEFRSLATIFLIGPVAGLVSVGFLRPWGRDVSGPSTQFSGDGFSDMHFDVRVVPSEQFSKWTQDASNAGRSLGQAFPAITLDVRASASGRVVRVRRSCASPNTRRLDTCRFGLRHVSGAFRVTITLQQDVQFSNQYPIREAINSRDTHGERIGGHPRKDEEAEDWTKDMNSRDC
jgi:hypothetical protein